MFFGKIYSLNNLYGLIFNPLAIRNAWVLLIDKPILKMLGINPELDEVELELEGKVLKVKKAED